MKKLLFIVFTSLLCTSLMSQKAYAIIGYNANGIRKDDFKSSLFLDSKLDEFNYFDGTYFNLAIGDDLWLVDIEYAFRGYSEKLEFTNDAGENLVHQLKLTNNTFALMLGAVVGSDQSGIATGLRLDFDHPKYKSRNYMEGEKKGEWEKIDLAETLHFRIGPSMKFFFALESGFCATLGGYYSWSIGGLTMDTFEIRRHSFGLTLGVGVWVAD